MTVIRRAVSLVLLLLMLAGIPVALWMLRGPPVHWPVRLPSIATIRADLAGLPHDTGLVLSVVQVIAWAGWLWFTAALAAEMIARRHGRRAKRIRGTGWMQELAARALTAATVGVAGTVPVIKVAALPAAAAPVHPGVQVQPNSLTHATRDRPKPDTGFRLYTIRPGDTLWGIAASQLGNPLRFREIAALNFGRVMDDGRTFRNVDWIYPGWVLRLPAAASSPAHVTAPTDHQDGKATCVPAAQAHRATPKHAVHAEEARHAAGIRLPSGAVIGISFAAAVSAAVLLARAHRSRTRTTASPEADQLLIEPSLPKPVAVMRQADLDNSLGGEQHHRRALPLLEPPASLLCANAPDGSELRLDLAAIGTLSVTGPGAAGAARAILCGLVLGTRKPVQVLIPEPDLRDLLSTDPGALDLPPGLTLVTDLDAALTQLESHKLRRARQTEDAQLGTDTGSVVLIATPADISRSRLEALLTGNTDQGISAILLGTLNSGTTCRVARDGLVEDVSDQPMSWPPGASLFTLGCADAIDVLQTAHDAAGTQEPDDHDEPQLPVQIRGEPLPAQRQLEGKPYQEADRPVHIKILGPATVRVRETEIATGLRTDARNLLALLAVHKDGLTIEAAADILWPDAGPDRSSTRFHTAVQNIRTVLRAESGARSIRAIIRAASRYRLDDALIDCDLWRFEDRLARAALSECDRVCELRAAVDAYTAPLLDGCDQEWAEPPRESVRRRAADAHRQLADLTWDHDPDTALGYLERALTIDEYNEELHQHLMCRQAAVGRLDAVRRTYQHLERSLAEIGAEPDHASHALVERLTKGSPDPRHRRSIRRSVSNSG